MPRPRLCVVRFSRRIPNPLKQSFLEEGEKLGLTVVNLNPNRKMRRAIEETIPLVEKGTTGVFLDIRLNRGRGNNGVVISSKSMLGHRLAIRVAARLNAITKNVREVLAVSKPIKDLELVDSITKGRLAPVQILPVYRNNKDQFHSNMMMEKQAKMLGRNIAIAAHSFIESHL